MSKTKTPRKPKVKKTPTPELPAMTGPGVEVLNIPELNYEITAYEKKKEARCAETPGEVEAKTKLTVLLHEHRDKLPINADGLPFYRHEGVDYMLEEKMKRRIVETEVDDD